ncbi:hypothetical protein LOK49_LG11G01108 [Camellia lanceoleosa]|uniref:Uncharacterized protein n=1 Tax=Camellia lanceoleosa TaxID=1840588 RepID=A0ACC0G3L9_9ERIC|nr:hypothetical protein LOK49_LG11G01108 [Camellia lanceoleosa]
MGGESGMKYMLKLGEKEGAMGEVEKWMNIVMDKLKELLVVLEDFGSSLIAKLDEVFPPDSRGDQLRHWLHVAAPFLIAAAVLLIMCLCCRCFFCCCSGMMSLCRRCCSGIMSLCRRCCCCCGRGVKTMKAPGRNYRMPRSTFESNPRSYFRDLRGKPLLDELV